MNPKSDILFSSDLWEPALEKYARATHVTVALFDASERMVFGPIHPTPLFQLFDHGGYDPGLFRECVRECLAQKFERSVVTTSKVHGLGVIGTSLVLDGDVVGAAVAGYVLLDFSQLSEIQRLAKDANLDFTRLWQVAREQVPVSQQRVTVNGELLQVLGDALLRENSHTRQYEQSALKLHEMVRLKDESLLALRESEERFRVLFDLGPVAVYSCDASGLIRDFNARAVELWGRTPKRGDTDERWCGSFKLLRPDGVFMPHAQCPMAEVLSGKLPEAHDLEVQIEQPDGARVTVIVNIRPLKNPGGEVVGAINCFVDITDRKRHEQDVREANERLEMLVEHRTAAVRKLSSEIIRSQDDERRRISRELHDSLGQYLSHAKMSLSSLKRVDASENETRSLLQLADDLDKCLSETRTISYLLHPPLLDELGLRSAMEWYVDGFSKRSDIRVNLNIPPEMKRLPRTLELVLFRILQESLVNVHRHSRSDSADIQLQLDAETVTLQIKDYGQGIPRQMLQQFRLGGAGVGVGLSSMRERMSELGGRLEIESDSGGTLIRVSAHLSAMGEKSAPAVAKLASAD